MLGSRKTATSCVIPVAIGGHSLLDVRELGALYIRDTMEKLFALATMMVIVAFAVVYTIAALNGPSKAK